MHHSTRMNFGKLTAFQRPWQETLPAFVFLLSNPSLPQYYSKLSNYDLLWVIPSQCVATNLPFVHTLSIHFTHIPISITFSSFCSLSSIFPSQCFIFKVILSNIALSFFSCFLFHFCKTRSEIQNT